MERVDYAHLAAPLDGNDPAGPDPEYDPVFLSLEQALRPTAVAMVAGAPEVEGVSTDWAALREDASGLAATTRDLRLSMRMARLALFDRAPTGGLAGFSGALTLAAQLLEGMWDHVYPRLDEDDDMDATMRLNAFGDLDDPRLVQSLLDVTVARAGRLSATLRDMEVAVGKREPQDGEDASEVSGRVAEIFSAPKSDRLEEASAAARDGVEALDRIRTAWTGAMTRIGETRGAEGLRFDTLPAPEMEALERRLSDIVRLVGERLPGANVGDSDAPEGEGEEGAPDAAGGTGGASSSPGAINSRADADRQILRIIEWFQRNEPSSPVPAMLERARSMISKSFLEIIDELGEGGISEARRAGGGGSDHGES